MGKFLLAWIPMIPIAIVNGLLREMWYGRQLGELRAHQVSTGTALLLISAYIFGVLRIWPPESSGQALLIGCLWLALTLGFELSFGRYVAGHSWSKLLQDYDVRAGRVWVLVPIAVAVAPYLFYRLLGGAR